MSDSLATGLNLAQQEAVNYFEGPCLVLACLLVCMFLGFLCPVL